MKKILLLLKKKPLIGNKISHSNKKYRKIFKNNIKKKKIFIRKNNFFIKLKINRKEIDKIDKFSNFLIKKNINYEK